MKSERFELYTEGEYTYPLGLGFVPNVHAYVHPEPGAKETVLVVPGGAYNGVSITEAEIVAMKFYRQGYQAVVLTYSTNPLLLEPLHDQALRDVARAVRVIRAKAEEWKVVPDKVAICGFSAGGHLCASLVTHWQDVEETNPAYAPFSCRPDRAILSYPVITSGEYAHRGSFDALIGTDPTAEELEYWSLEKQVTEKACPCFLWHTRNDSAVPVQNTYLFARALDRVGVAYAMHIFSCGPHGLSTADDDWVNCRFGDAEYVAEQHRCLAEAVLAGTLHSTPALEKNLLDSLKPRRPDPARTGSAEVAAWPELAMAWMKTL